ncbi:ankyrin-3-like [Haliotis cracherodii]|uniref:ankyrin-3-like n=1 Tax=Haliotis cracherodii TaxID=6455 RepID=UPI0039E87885
MSLISSLHEAIQNGELDTVIRLVEKGADINATYIRETAFTQALESERFNIAVRIMGSRTFNPNAGNKFERTPLFCAAKDGKYEIAVALLNKGADINLADISGVTPLGATAWYDRHQVAQLLIDRGADINQQDSSGETPLYRACANVSVKVSKVLLENGADKNLQTYEGNSCPQFTPLMAAIPSKYQLEVRRRRMTEMIGLLKMMLSHGCDVNMVNKHMMTALHVAVDRIELYGACLLAEHGCDLEVKDKDGMTPLHLAIQPCRPQYEMALFLLLYGADANSKFKDKQSGKVILPLTMVLKTRPENELVQKHRAKLLHALIPATDLSGRNVFEVIETMLENLPVFQEDFDQLQDFNVNQPSSLQGHCRRRIRRCLGQHVFEKIETLPVGWQVKQYLALDCDYRRQHPHKSCDIHICVLDNKIDRLKILLSEGCDVNVPLADKIPLTLAAQTGNVNAVNVLLDHGADPAMLDRGGQSALHAAAMNGSDNVVRVLLTTKCNINALNAAGNTAVQEAANMGHFETVMVLLYYGANSSIVGPGGIPCIHLAAGSGHLKAVEGILKISEDIRLIDRFGNTPLHIAASKGIVYLKNNVRLPALYNAEVLELIDAVKLPLTSGFPQYTRVDGVHHFEVVEMLLKGGVNRRALKADKKLAMDLANEYFKDAVELIVAL